jgi:hypothetical protein
MPLENLLYNIDSYSKITMAYWRTRKSTLTVDRVAQRKVKVTSRSVPRDMTLVLQVPDAGNGILRRPALLLKIFCKELFIWLYLFFVILPYYFLDSWLYAIEIIDYVETG